VECVCVCECMYGVYGVCVRNVFGILCIHVLYVCVCVCASLCVSNSWQECVTRHVITQSAPFSDSHVNGVLSPRFSRLPALLAS